MDFQGANIGYQDRGTILFQSQVLAWLHSCWVGVSIASFAGGETKLFQIKILDISFQALYAES